MCLPDCVPVGTDFSETSEIIVINCWIARVCRRNINLVVIYIICGNGQVSSFRTCPVSHQITRKSARSLCIIRLEQINSGKLNFSVIQYMQTSVTFYLHVLYEILYLTCSHIQKIQIYLCTVIFKDILPANSIFSPNTHIASKKYVFILKIMASESSERNVAMDV